MNKQDNTTDVRTSRFSLSNVNGLVLAGAVLAGTIISAGATEIRFQMSDARQAQSSNDIKLSNSSVRVPTMNSVVR